MTLVEFGSLVGMVMRYPATAIVIAGVLSGAFTIWWTGKTNRANNQIQTDQQTKQQERITALKAKFETELERVKSDLVERREAYAQITQMLSSGYGISQERRLKAIEELWSRLVRMDDLWAQHLRIYLLVKLGTQLNAGNRSLIRRLALPSPEQSDSEWDQAIRAATTVRPFVGEKLWALFNVYARMEFTLAALVESAKDSDVMPEFNATNYPYVIDFINHEDLEAIVKKYEIGIPNRILDRLRQEIVDEANRLIFGEHLVTVALKHRAELEVALSAPRNSASI